MTDKKMIALGEKVEIITNFADRREKVYFSMIQDILDEDTFVINLPMSKRERAFLYIGQEVAVNYFRCHGQYYFLAMVIERYEKENVYYFKLKKISDIHRLQRRNYFRLAKTIPIKIDILDQDNKTNIETINGYTFNICGGGVGVIVQQDLPVNTNVKCTFELKLGDNIDKFSTKAKVVRCNHIDDQEDKFEVGICFEDMPEQQRDEIIKFIFNEQRRLRKRGLI